MEEEQVSQINTDPGHIDEAEKTVGKFLDAQIEKDAEAMRKTMSDAFQANYNFSKLNEQQKDLLTSFKITKVSKEAGSISVVADLEYENSNNSKITTKQYSYSLVTDHISKKLLINSEKPTKKSIPFYKKPLFWIVTVIAAVLVIGGIYWLVTKNKTSQTQQAIATDWQEITQSANNVDQLSQNATRDQQGFDNYAKEIRSLNNLISDKKAKSDQLKITNSDKTDVENYKSALSGMSSYIQDAVDQSSSVSDYTTSDSEKLNELADSAKNAVNNFQSNAKFLKSTMPEQIYKIADTLDKVKEELNKSAQKAAAAKAAEQQAAAQDTANKNAVTTSVNTFQQGFIAGSANTMRPVMTSGFQSEYNFNQLNPDQRQYQYPASYRIITVTKQTDGTYKAQVNVVFKDRQSPNQYTQGFEYSVVNDNNKWLLNDEKIGNGF